MLSDPDMILEEKVSAAVAYETWSVILVELRTPR